MLNIVLFGAPGCGKGTQAARLAERYNLNHISTGEVIRREIDAGTPLGRSVGEYIRRGELVPDALVIDLVADYVERHRECAGNIFDGFPRTLAQAEAFDRILSRAGLSVTVVVSLDVPQAELIRRLLLRGTESGRADDASEEVIRNRIKVYDAQTAPVADYYAGQGKHAVVEGVGAMDEVFDRIRQVVDARLG